MGKTSSAVKRRWNNQNYDTYGVSLPKGLKEKLKAACQQQHVSMNSVFVAAAQRFVEENSARQE